MQTKSQNILKAEPGKKFRTEYFLIGEITNA